MMPTFNKIKTKLNKIKIYSIFIFNAIIYVHQKYCMYIYNTICMNYYNFRLNLIKLYNKLFLVFLVASNALSIIAITDFIIL